jgi:hypothetical protein
MKTIIEMLDEIRKSDWDIEIKTTPVGWEVNLNSGFIAINDKSLLEAVYFCYRAKDFKEGDSDDKALKILLGDK